MKLINLNFANTEQNKPYGKSSLSKVEMGSQKVIIAKAAEDTIHEGALLDKWSGITNTCLNKNLFC